MTDAPPHATAEVEILRELLGVAVHDLSNPLQSLSVLLELAADEAETGESVRDKLEHAMTAAEQLRELIRALADFSRAEPRQPAQRTLGRALDQALNTCSRRFERQRISVVRATAQAEALAPVDARLRVTMLGALLACIHASGRSGMSTLELEISAPAPSEGLVCVRFCLAGDAGQPLALDARDLDRIASCAGNEEPSLAFEDLGPGRFALQVRATEALNADEHD